MTDIDESAMKVAGALEAVLRRDYEISDPDLAVLLERALTNVMRWSYNQGMSDLEKSLEVALKKKGIWK